jgi:hypothetical protein
MDELQKLKDQMFVLSGIVSQAISDLEDIAEGKPQTYADTLDNQLKHGSRGRRAMTMKDVKPIARRTAKALREVWEFLDPTGN